MEMRKKKAELRQIFASYRDEIPEEIRERASLVIKERLFALEEFQKASYPVFFVSFGSEVNTRPMIIDALQMGKQVIVPLTEKKERRLLLSRLEDFEKDLQPGVFGILEPHAESFRPVSPEDVDLVLVPGLVFGLNGYRIGYGGGYYDRFLENIPVEVPRIGLCYEGQVVEEVPHGNHDFPVNKIVTEERVVLVDLD